jgi:iron complex transport system permease protein
MKYKTSGDFLIILLIIITLTLFLMVFNYGHERPSLYSLATGDVSNTQLTVVLDLILPTYLSAWLLGMGLGSVGCVMQGLLRNPLADPAILGISSGSTFFGMIAFILIYSNVPSVLSSMYHLLIFIVASFIGAIVVSCILFFLAQKIFYGNLSYVLLAGIALSSLFNALTIMAITFLDAELFKQAITWTLGNFANASWTSFAVLMISYVLGMLFFITQIPGLNLLALGESLAQSSGVNMNILFLNILVGSGLIIASSVAIAGPIGFIGLIAPHIARLIGGSDHRQLLFASALTGGCLLITTTYLSLEINYPEIMTLGVITSLLGAPFFLWVLIRQYLKHRII